MSNKLKNQTSPYLLQHKDNPVNWYPWCDEAFEMAKKDNKPIFLSIGYSTCHWCHVMAHESFENKEIADILNKNFISIKVDREERPDIDSVYMSVCQAFTGSGGWPMSIFMTWDKKPFFAGTYFPPSSRYNMIGFNQLLGTISKEWNLEKEHLIKSAEEVINHLTKSEDSIEHITSTDIIKSAIGIFKDSFDVINGGFGSTPKFPTPHNLIFLMLYAKENNNFDVLKMAEKTLVQMRKGGLYDHIGYGFSRYSTDKFYLVPHFEKMLYDNALLIIAYCIAFNITKNDLYLNTAKQTSEYIINEMSSEYGGFYCAQDADSEGVEGKYYTFSKKEVLNVLNSNRGENFAKAFDITEKGNFEGTNIPNLLKSEDFKSNFDEEIRMLYNYRKNRFKLHLDDKILLAWNSMMISAFSIMYRITKEEKYLYTAKKSLDFLEDNLSDGLNLFTSFRNGKHTEHSFLDDYAYYISALIEYYSSSLDTYYLKKAESFLNKAVDLFADNENGGYYMSIKGIKELFINPKESYDGAIPSGNSVMTYNLVRLYHITEKDIYKELLEKQISYMSLNSGDYPSGHTMFLVCLLLYENPLDHITIVLKDYCDLKGEREKLAPFANIKIVSPSNEYPLINNKTTYYVCRNHNCLPPTNKL